MKTTLFQAKQAFYSICLFVFLLWAGVSSFTMLYVWENIHVLKVYRNKQLPARPASLQYRMQGCMKGCSINCSSAVSPVALQYRMQYFLQHCSITCSASVSPAALHPILQRCTWYCSAEGATAALHAILQPCTRYCSDAGNTAALQAIVYFYKPLRHEYSLKHKA